MLANDRPGLDIELHNAVAQAACELLTSVKVVLRPTLLMPGRKHYLFTLRDLVTSFQVNLQFFSVSIYNNETSWNITEPCFVLATIYSSCYMTIL